MYKLKETYPQYFPTGKKHQKSYDKLKANCERQTRNKRSHFFAPSVTFLFSVFRDILSLEAMFTGVQVSLLRTALGMVFFLSMGVYFFSYINTPDSKSTVKSLHVKDTLSEELTQHNMEYTSTCVKNLPNK